MRLHTDHERVRHVPLLYTLFHLCSCLYVRPAHWYSPVRRFWLRAGVCSGHGCCNHLRHIHLHFLAQVPAGIRLHAEILRLLTVRI